MARLVSQSLTVRVRYSEAKKRRFLRSGFRYLLCLQRWFRCVVIWPQAGLRGLWRVRNVRAGSRIFVGGVRGVVAIDGSGRSLCGR